MTAATAIVLTAHGTVESLDDLPEFLTNIRRGHAPPPELVEEVRRRYEAIGGRSPLLDITSKLAERVEAATSLRTRVAMRLFHPYPKPVLTELVAQGVRRVVTLPLAQHSAPIYGAAMKAAAREVDPELEVLCAKNWGQTSELTQAFAASVAEALGRVPAGKGDETAIVFTAHSLPQSIVLAGDPYEREVRASAEAIAAELRARGGPPLPEHHVAFQSQGIGSGVAWLGPDLEGMLRELASRGKRHVVVAPIGFLADHVEILYDLDIEAMGLATTLGIALYRSASLNAGDGIVRALVAVASEILASPDRFQVEESARGRPAKP